MKSVKFKVGPFECNSKSCATNTTDPSSPTKAQIECFSHSSTPVPPVSLADSAAVVLNKKVIFSENYDEDEDEYDEAVRVDYDADEDDDYEMNEVVVLDAKSKQLQVQDPMTTVNSSNNNLSTKSVKSVSSVIITTNASSGAENNSQNAQACANNHQSDSASSSESGFGTVDDEHEKNENAKAESAPQQQNADNTSSNSNSKPMLTPPDSTGNSASTNISSNSSSSGLAKSFQNNCLPILQPPRQIVYELTGNQPDDVVNILNGETSSINSLGSSDTSLTLTNCCSKFFNKLMAFYYSCFCCYLSNNYNPSAAGGQTPFVCSWLSIFCCCCPILGAVSLYLTHRSRKYKLKQKYELAEKYSNYAEKLNIAALIFGVIFYAIAFFLITLVIFMFWRSKRFWFFSLKKYLLLLLIF